MSSDAFRTRREQTADDLFGFIRAEAARVSDDQADDLPEPQALDYLIANGPWRTEWNAAVASAIRLLDPARFGNTTDDHADKDSSVSRQHYIDTGRYLTVGEVAEARAAGACD